MENHFIQMEILSKLLFAEQLSFSKLKSGVNIENNKLDFHIKSLIAQKLIVKNKNITYSLTNRGKEYANRMDTDRKVHQTQGKIGAITCCIRNTKFADEPEFLVYTRKKHPFYNSQGFASGKIPIGQSVIESARRELKEETNLDATNEGDIFMIEHHRVYDKASKELLEDKYFYFVRFVDPEGELKPNKEGVFEWVKDSKFSNYLNKPFESITRLIYIKERIKDAKKPLTFEEIVHYADNF